MIEGGGNPTIHGLIITVGNPTVMDWRIAGEPKKFLEDSLMRPKNVLDKVVCEAERTYDRRGHGQRDPV
jgi:hypothetical protein